MRKAQAVNAFPRLYETLQRAKLWLMQEIDLTNQNYANTLAGKFLIAMPDMDDIRFARSVIYICVHDEEHAMGLVINRPIEGIDLQKILEQLEIPNTDDLQGKPVFEGGPVSKSRGFVLHTNDFNIADATLKISPRLSMTATKEALLALGSKERPLWSKLALGYAGWGAGQLEQELTENIWLIADNEDAILFNKMSAKDMWETALASIGVYPNILASGRA